MFPKLLKLLYRNYVKLRRLMHSFITFSPFLNRVVGQPLRGLTRSIEEKLAESVLPNPINIESHVLFYRREDAKMISRISLGCYEVEVKEVIINYLRPGMTMIDAGANIGYYTLLAARIVGAHGHVYAFEPVTSTVTLLKKNVEINGYADRIVVVPKALSDRSSRSKIFIDKISSGSASMYARDCKELIEVETISLDEFFAKNGHVPIHMVKMDIEGAEKLALDGMKELSSRNPGLKLIIEVNLIQYDLKELTKSLLSCGFSRFYVLEKSTFVTDPPKELPRVVPTIQYTSVNLLCEKSKYSGEL